MALTKVSAGVLNTDDIFGFRNRIINGDMRIDQRNNGSAVTISTNAVSFAVDRFFGFGQATDGVFTLGRSTVAPAGFTNSLVATVTTADSSVGASQLYIIDHRIEGFNAADLNWGTANAKTITLSFWTRSSLTGTFGGSLVNFGQTRSYPFTYTINAANTWEYKTITVPGDTGGTWLTDNSIGIEIVWSLGMGSTFTGTAGAWSGSALFSATGANQVISTLNANLYITGVQLEVGSVATPFERRPYGTELALCQRYFYQWSAASASSAIVGSGQAFGSTSAYILMKTPMTMRAPPSTFSSAGNFGSNNASGGGLAVTAISLVGSWTNENMITLQATVSSGWTAGNVALMNGGADANCRLNFSAEL